MKVGILADTHDELSRTKRAVELLQQRDARTLVHCGDLATPPIVEACSVLPLYFVFGNHDADVVPELRSAAQAHDATCLGWGGEFFLAGKRVAVVHGHMTMDLKPLLNSEPHYLLSGHSHEAKDWHEGATRRINPGALFRAAKFTVALLDLGTDTVEFIHVEQ